VHDLLADAGGQPGLATPSTAVTAATATMAPVSQASRGRSRSGSAVSMTARSRNGEAMATIDEATMVAVTTASGRRCGAKSRPMRRSETSRAWARSAAVTRGDAEVGRRGPELGSGGKGVLLDGCGLGKW
jgi:hypothetical protein